MKTWSRTSGERSVGEVNESHASTDDSNLYQQGISQHHIVLRELLGEPVSRSRLLSQGPDTQGGFLHVWAKDICSGVVAIVSSNL